ncbi:hypothetical protein [Sphingobacterium sp. IITKGP-BTPF85]|uniref:hypothetical protein n=1 Tax=Sphingobacterium sp. IITKGP-BTPF85 TaxID=1338009 RepID=UPI0003F4ED11|nr:hypothetical protein [Sphingobacterium sp. IITKGP-BTPF85]
MGQRANFEEDYSGKSLSGSYLAGVYYPDKPALVGGKMVILNILRRLLTLSIGLVFISK